MEHQTLLVSNKGESAASFCCHVAEWFPDMFCNFYSVKIHKIAKNSATAKAREKISTDLEFLELSKTFNVCLTNFKNDQVLHNKIRDSFLLTTKLLNG